MKKTGNKIIAQAGYCLRADNGLFGLSLPYEESVEYKEEKMSDKIVIMPYDTISIGNTINIKNNGTIKKNILDFIYTNDDQIAIILNKDDGTAGHLEDYNLMQEWREYASNVARKIMELVEN